MKGTTMGSKVRAEHYLQYLKHRYDVRMQEYDELQKNYVSCKMPRTLY